MAGATGFGSGSFSGNGIGHRVTQKTVYSAGIFAEILFDLEMANCNPFTQNMCVCSYSSMAHHTENLKTTATYGSNNVFELKANGDLVSSVILVYLFKALQAHIPPNGPTGAYVVVDNDACPLTNEDNAAIAAMSGGLAAFLTGLGAPSSGTAVPSSSPCVAATDPYASYCPYVALFAAHAVYLKSGDNVVDAYSGASYLAAHELTGDIEERAHTTWGGQTLTEAIELSETNMFAYVKTQFTLTGDLGSSLAICASLFTKTEIQVDMRSLHDVLIRSDDNVEIQVAGAPIANTDLDMALDVMYIILDDDMRDMYQSTQFEVIVMRTLAQNGQKPVGQTDLTVNLNVKGFIVGMVVLCQRELARKKNLYNNFQGVAGLPPLTDIQLAFDANVYASGEASRFSDAHPQFLDGGNVPKIDAYFLAFSPHAALHLKNNHRLKNTIPGGINMNTIDDLHLSLTFQAALTSESVHVTVLSHQVTFAQYKNGQLRIYENS